MNAFWILLIALFPVLVNAQVPERPSPPKLVNDLADILSPEEERTLENKLVALDDSTGNQIAILTITDLKDYQPWEFGHMVIEQWGIGQKDKNNGVVILVKPKTPSENGQLHISVGYGLEGAIPDAVANQISDNEMIPYFKQNRYFDGINHGTDILGSLASGEYSAADYQKKAKDKGFPISPVFIILLIVFILSFFNRGKKKHKSIGHGIPNLAWWLLASQMGKRHSGSWGDFRGGSGSFGGGGGFGGFGGGSSGGGGAGGSW